MKTLITFLFLSQAVVSLSGCGLVGGAIIGAIAPTAIDDMRDYPCKGCIMTNNEGYPTEWTPEKIAKYKLDHKILPNQASILMK